MSGRARGPVDPQPWRVQNTRRVLDDQWLRIRADRCLSDEGTVFDPWYVVEQPDWVQIVAITEAEEIVLIQQYRHGRGIVSTELPGGKLDGTDEKPLEAARRELSEETGFTAAQWQIVASLPVNPANQSNLSHVALATGARLTLPPVNDPTERIRVLTVPAATAVVMARSGEITHAAHVAGLALTLTMLSLWR